jgi:hypothetical protein
MIKIAVISNVKEVQGDGLEKMVNAINKQLSYILHQCGL